MDYSIMNHYRLMDWRKWKLGLGLSTRPVMPESSATVSAGLSDCS